MKRTNVDNHWPFGGAFHAPYIAVGGVSRRRRILVSDKLACVLMPGLDGTGRLFEAFVRSAPGEYELIVISYPLDRSFSYEELVPLVVRALPADNPYLLVAESYSGPLALRLANDAPEGLRGIVLCNTFVRPPVWKGWRYAPWGLLFRLPVPSFAMRRFLVGPDSSGSLIDRVRSAIQQVDPNVLTGRIKAIFNVDATPWLAACRYPVLYLRGGSDMLVPKECVEEMQEIKPDLKVKVLDGPHLLLQTSVHESWMAVESFAKDLLAVQ